MGGDLGDDRRRQGVGVVGLAGGDQSVPGGQVRARVGARSRVVAQRKPERVESGDVGGLLDSDRRRPVGAEVGRVGDVVERSAVGHQRVGEVRPGPLRHGGGNFHLRSGRALPVGQRAVGQHRAVAQRGQRHRDPAAVGHPGGADLLRLGDAFVGQHRDQVLGVAHFDAVVHQVVVARFAFGAQWNPVGVGGPAGAAPASVAHAEDRIAVFGPALGLGVDPDLRAAPAVEVADQRIRPVRPGGRGGREDHVDVDLGLAVPGRRRPGAEPHVAGGGLSGAADVAAVEGAEIRRGGRGGEQGSGENRDDRAGVDDRPGSRVEAPPRHCSRSCYPIFRRMQSYLSVIPYKSFPSARAFSAANSSSLSTPFSCS
jgi:hypothetical protein